MPNTFALILHVVITVWVGYMLAVGIPKVQWTYKMGKEYLEYCQQVLSQEHYRIREFNRRNEKFQQYLPYLSNVLQFVLAANIAYFLYLINSPTNEETRAFFLGVNFWGVTNCLILLYSQHMIVKVVNNYHAMVRQQQQQESIKDPNPSAGNSDKD